MGLRFSPKNLKSSCLALLLTLNLELKTSAKVSIAMLPHQNVA